MNLDGRTTTRAAALALLALCLCACRPEQAGNNAANTPQPTRSSADDGAAAAPDTGGLDSEIATLTQQAEKSPGDQDTLDALSKAYYRRGEARRGADQLREALSDYQHAIRANPDNEEAKQRVAEISPQFERETTGEYGEPPPLPITPNVTTGDEGTTEPAAGAQDTPTPTPTPKKKRQ